MKKKVNRPLAASAAVLVGTGLAVAGQPAHAVAAAPEAAPGTAAAQAPVQAFERSQARSPLIVYRSGRVAASASISAAPKVHPAKKGKKRVKRKHRSRRS